MMVSSKNAAFGYLFVAFLGLSFSISLCEASSKLQDGSLEEGIEHEETERDDLEIDITVITCIVLLLIALTIAFEAVKEHIEHHAHQTMKPIIEKLFGEMTVLGFLSIFTFVVTQAGFFGEISERVFGEEEDLLELFEFVHFTIFFLMILFVIQVLISAHEAVQTSEEWEAFEKAAQDPQRQGSWQQLDERGPLRSFIVLLPGFRDLSSQENEDQVLYKALRDEFILERSTKYPFARAPEERRVDPDFDFSHYLTLSLSNMLTHIVEVHSVTWYIFVILTIVHYVFSLAVKENLTILSWLWVALGWFVFASNVFFEHHLIEIRKAFASREVFLEAQATDETTSLNSQVSGEEHLPGWCYVDMEGFLEKRSWLARLLAGGTPNRQQSLYLMDRKGPKYYMLALQMNLLFLGLYAAMHVLGFVGHMFESQSTGIFVIYVILALLPLLGILFQKKHLFAVLTQVCNIGAYRKPNFVADVLREERTARVVRAFIVLYKMRRFATRAKGSKPRDRETGKKLVKQFDPIELKAVGKTFDAFDTSGTGQITYSDLEQLMTNLGSSIVSHEDLNLMISLLDEDGDGTVSKEEFILWYAENAGKDDFSPHERAKFLFEIFDSSDNSGEVSVGEFKEKLDALNMGFHVDEVGDIVSRLDHNNNGTIGVHEFDDLLERYYPKELRGEGYRPPSHQSSGGHHEGHHH